uniref:Uncharacterized protein n=1 Tax=Rhizophora mucronata TaxID=61149 RepID=A0A2P2J6Y1_RHIMU
MVFTELTCLILLAKVLPMMENKACTQWVLCLRTS